MITMRVFAKRATVFALVLMLVLTLFTVSAGAAYKPITVYVNGEELVLDVPPVIENGRTLVPMRAIFEALDCDVEWVQETKTVIVYTQYLLCIELQIGNSEATTYFLEYGDNYEDGPTGKGDVKKITMDVPARIEQGRTLVPLRFVSETIGFDVEWSDYYKHVYVGNCAGLITQLGQQRAASQVTLYSADGSSISVDSGAVSDYLSQGWCESKEAAEESTKQQKDIECARNIRVGDTVVQNQFFILRQGVVQAVDYQTGQVQVRWTLVTDAAGGEIQGMYGMLYGNLYGTDWIGASALVW